MKIAVGSKNPVKVRATQTVFKKVFKNKKIEVVSIDVPSGVHHTPRTWDETVKGSLNRAKKVLKKARADFGVGLEGGIEKTKFGTFLYGVVVIVDKKGRVGISDSNGLLLPDFIVKKLDRGRELGDVMDELQKDKNTKQKWGAVGFFLKHFTNRQKSFEQTILHALARFLREELY
ncbi:MAG: inosine/xanthosine triphosphatase [Elusimicrobia bacterium]|nr:inosine/xanthosine triphosphatase [Elusimicrobiota bacterium]